VSIPLGRIEEITGGSGVAPQIEALLPTGVRHRQLRVRTLLAGMMLTQADHRPAHLDPGDLRPLRQEVRAGPSLPPAQGRGASGSPCPDTNERQGTE
jgi:hypothetical protein